MKKPATTRVINVKSGADFDVYVGRGKCPKTGQKGVWGNPFQIGDVYNGQVMSRSRVIQQYRDWLEGSADGMELLEGIWQLQGKTLGCWCKPELCHGDVLAEIADMYPPIKGFFQSYRFLSNLYGGAFSLEHEFQAAKATNESDRQFVLSADKPREARRRGKYIIKCRPDWENIKMETMLGLLEKKFSAAPLRNMLIGTGYSYLEETNDWHDTTYGVCTCAQCGDAGINMLGEMLMNIRRRLRFGEL